MPPRDDFIEWISARYHDETDLTADEVMICRWERTSEDITRLAPEVDGLRVEAALFSKSGGTNGGDLLVHYVLCRYHLVTDEWYLHAASWGGGFWVQDRDEWGHLVEECRQRAEQMKRQREEE